MDVFEFGAPPPRPPSRHAWILPLVLLLLVTGGGSVWRVRHQAAPHPAPSASPAPGAEPVLQFAAPGAALSTATPLDGRTLTAAAQAALPDPQGPAGSGWTPDIFQAASEFWQETVGVRRQYRLDIACAGAGEVRLTVTQLAGEHRGQVYVRAPVPCVAAPQALEFRFAVRQGTFGLVVQPVPGTAAIVALRQEPSVG